MLPSTSVLLSVLSLAAVASPLLGAPLPGEQAVVADSLGPANRLSASEKVEHFVVGAVDSVGDTFKGGVHAALHPIESGAGMIRTVSHPGQTFQAIKEDVHQAFREDPARATGYAVGTGLLMGYPFYREVPAVHQSVNARAAQAGAFVHDVTVAPVSKFLAEREAAAAAGRVAQLEKAAAAAKAAEASKAAAGAEPLNTANAAKTAKAAAADTAKAAKVAQVEKHLAAAQAYDAALQEFTAAEKALKAAATGAEKEAHGQAVLAAQAKVKEAHKALPPTMLGRAGRVLSTTGGVIAAPFHYTQRGLNTVGGAIVSGASHLKQGALTHVPGLRRYVAEPVGAAYQRVPALVRASVGSAAVPILQRNGESLQ